MTKNIIPQNSIKSPRLTPMMVQYSEIKAGYNDALLFYRMGDFYELFFNDAITASKILGITLTKRGKQGNEDIPMCGVPVHSADDYLFKLIEAGQRVAICEQVEDTADNDNDTNPEKRSGKSLIKRKVVRLVTRGTLTEEKLLEPTRNHYLMSLVRLKNDEDAPFGLAWIDISTGQFRVGLSHKSRLLADIMRVDPQEIIMAQSLFHNPQLNTLNQLLNKIITPQPPSLFESSTAEHTICRYFNLSTLAAFGEFSAPELAAIAGAINYIEKTQVQGRPPLMRPRQEDSKATLFIDSATRLNLELMRTSQGEKEGSLFKAIDRTVTNAGARLLAERLLAPLTHPQTINERLDSVSFFLQNSDLAPPLETALQGAPDTLRALSRLVLGRGGPRDLAAMRTSFDRIDQINQLLNNILLPQELAHAQNLLAQKPIEVHHHLCRALADDLPLLKRDGGFIRTHYHSELDQLRELRDQSRRYIASLQSTYSEKTGIKTLKIKHNNILGYFIEVSANTAGALSKDEATKARFIHRQTMANAMRFTTNELAELESKIAHAGERAQKIEEEIFSQLVAELEAQTTFIREAAQALAVFDVARALAQLAQEQSYCRPQIDNSLAFRIIDGRHPVVEQALRQQTAQPFIANNCDLTPAKGDQQAAIWLLTGPNMGGKSTFLRQNALIAIMAQMGSFVPAGSAHIGTVDKLFSRVGASDDLARGRSTFMVEMVETATILHQATSRSLVILDEIGRGTATFDGLSIAWAAVEYLYEINQARAILATHFHEMTALCEKLPRLHNVTMRVKEWHGEVIFLHEVTKGVADRSYGVQVAKLAGLPKTVIARARAILEQLEKHALHNKNKPCIDDFPLFSAFSNSPTPDPTSSAITDKLRTINPDDLSPREALDALYQLKKLISPIQTTS